MREGVKCTELADAAWRHPPERLGLPCSDGAEIDLGAKILLATYGSRGDVEPFLALALGLKSCGYSVSLMTSTRFAGWIGAYGVDFLPMSDDTLAQIETDDGRAVLDSSTGWFKRLKAGRRLAQKAKPFAKQMIEDAWAGARAFGPDLIVFHPKVLGAPHIAEKLGIPAMLVFLQPMFVPTSSFPVPGFPALPLPGYNRLSYGIVSLSFGLYRKAINQFRRQIGLPAISSRNEVLSPRKLAPVPVLHPIGRHVVPRPDDWPDWAHVTGFWRLPLPADYAPDPALKAFLDAGPPPVYAGFGSMPVAHPGKFGDMLVEAIRAAGQRGVIASGWGGLKAIAANDIFVLDAAPHDWLFPRMSAIIHHGGAGTTAAGFHAGVPSIICPFGVDQPCWAQLSVKLGVGAKPVPRKSMTAEKLEASIREAVNDQGMQERARELGEKLRNEDGTGEAVDIIETLLAGAPKRR